MGAGARIRSLEFPAMTITDIQQALIRHGYDLVEDGIFGERTLGAVLDLQRHHQQLKSDWPLIVGARTQAALSHITRVMHRLSEDGLDFITFNEGMELEAYQDGGGVWTIGVGHTSDKHQRVYGGLTITSDRAQELLRIDCMSAQACVNESVSVPLHQWQYDALVDFTFNLGNSAFSNSTLLRLLNQGDYEAAADQFSRWVYDNGERVEGLVLRREREAALFTTGAFK